MADFEEACARAGIARLISRSALDRAMYSSDASLYRIPPAFVARPHTVDDVQALVHCAASSGLAITARGAGTSCAGNAVGPGVVIDLRALNELRICPDTRTAVVEPGVVLADLNREAAKYGLRYGPDPSTASRCTIGGMVGNNACGPRAMFYGRTSDTMLAVEYVTASGDVEIAGEGARWDHVRELAAGALGPIRTQSGRFPRQVSGYSMEHLLPERFNAAAFWAGTEGTLGISTRLTVALSQQPAATHLIALGYPTMAEAADAVPGLLAFDVIACEGLDNAILDVLRRRGRELPPLPHGTGFLILEVGGETPAEAASRAVDVLSAGLVAGALDGLTTTDPALWKIRADGAGLAAVGLERPAHAGWEDAAVPPEQLGAYLREFTALLDEHGLKALPYGHFGSGCVHARIDFPLASSDGARRYREFIVAAGELVAAYGGSMSGEHGDGRARSELLPLMYSPEMLRLFGAIKEIFDPQNLLNPGVLVDPAPLDGSLRIHESSASPLAKLHPDFAAHAHRCTGVGACTSHQPGAGMCPSHRARGEEKDSTRGRARALQEMIDGRLITGGWNSPEIAEALELCLACKACRSECPTSVDMAGLKSEVLEQRWRRRIRPLSHYALGWLPRWLALARRLPRISNLVIPVVAPLAGIDSLRAFPKLRPFCESRDLAQSALPPTEAAKPVALWVDSFSQSFSPASIAAMVEVLVAAGYVPQLVTDACCGLTWITTGQREGARRRLRAALDILEPLAARGIPIVGMEPSCTAVWHCDAQELLDDPRVGTVSSHMHTLAQFLVAAGWTPPSLSGHTIVAQPHCHHNAVMGWEADAALLKQAGADVVDVHGCCGMAGNFGMEQSHRDMSLAVAELELLPAIRAAGDDAILLADGFSCRTHIKDLVSRDGVTLAQVLAAHLPNRPNQTVEATA